MITVMLVDDHDLVRSGIKRIIDDESGMKVVAEAHSGEQALKLAKQLQPNVVLMDLKMPGIGGYEATRKMLRFNPDAKILIVTVCTADLYPSKLLQAGAMGYLTKGATKEELIHAIRAVNSGQRYMSPDIANNLAIRHIDDKKRSPYEELSDREVQISIMVTTGVKVAEIADRLCLSPKTVNSYRYRIYEKLKIKTDVELTILAIRHGLIEAEDANLAAQ